MAGIKSGRPDLIGLPMQFAENRIQGIDPDIHVLEFHFHAYAKN